MLKCLEKVHICFYYQLTSGIEKRIYDTLEMRKNYTERLFENEVY